MKLKPNKKRKIATWLKEHKAIVIGTGSFLLVGLLALLIGYEIKENGHAIRNFLSGPNATTLIILLIVGVFFLGLFVISIIYINRGDE